MQFCCKYFAYNYHTTCNLPLGEFCTSLLYTKSTFVFQHFRCVHYELEAEPHHFKLFAAARAESHHFHTAPKKHRFY
jgi:hypothetical protein